jgi:NTP pyrophosphatase (non-canonical NTP hydrolase)
MNKEQQEILDILQEECAEVIQMISKCRRFGIDEFHIKSGEINRGKLTEEIGDLMCMVKLAVKSDIINNAEVELACKRKLEKLKTWSNISILKS